MTSPPHTLRLLALALLLAAAVPATARAEGNDLWEVDATLLFGENYARPSVAGISSVGDWFAISESLRFGRRFLLDRDAPQLDVGVDVRFPILDSPVDLGLALVHLGVQQATNDQQWDVSVVVNFGGGLEFFDNPTFGAGSRASLQLGGRVDVRYFASDMSAEPRLFVGLVAMGGGPLLGSEGGYWSLGIALGFTTGKNEEEAA